MDTDKDKEIEKTIETLKKDFIVVGKTRVRSWHAWLIIGLCVGILAGILFVANRSGKFELSKAALVCDDYGCYDDAIYWDTYDPGVAFFDPAFYSNPFDQFDADLLGFADGILPQNFDSVAIDIGAVLDPFTVLPLGAFYPAEGAAALNVSENLIENINNAAIDDPNKWLDENVDSRLSAIGVPDNQIGLIDNAQLSAPPGDFLNADDEVKEIIGYDPTHLILPRDAVSATDKEFSQTFKDSGLNLTQATLSGQPNVSLVVGNLDSSLINQWKNDLSSALENSTPTMQSIAEQTAIILLNKDEFNLIAGDFFGTSNQSNESPAFIVGSEDVSDEYTAIICGDCVLTPSMLSERLWLTDQSDFSNIVLTHELIHAAFNVSADPEAFDIFSQANTTFEGDSCASPHACENPTELFASAAEAYTFTNGVFSPVPQFSPAYENWLRQIDWLLRHGFIKPISVASGSSFNIFPHVFAATVDSTSPFLISNMSFGQRMFRLPDVGAINSAADTGLTFLGAINPVTGWVPGNVGMSKPGASAHLISEGAYLIRDISNIALKISEFGVEQAKKYAASGKDVSARDQAAGAASILVALDDHARFSKEAENAIKAYANAPGSKDILEENPRFLKTAFVSAAQLEQKSPSSAEAQNADAKARMFFTASRYLSADLSAISTMISYQASMEQYFNIQTVVASAYTARSKTLAEDTLTIAGNKTLISSAKTKAAASVTSAKAIYARINKIALAKKTAEVKAINVSALSELNKINSASASISSAASRASTLVKTSSSVSSSINKSVAKLPGLISDLRLKTTNAIYNEAILLSDARAKIADSIVGANKISGATTEATARALASKAIVDLNNIVKWFDPTTLNNTSSLFYYHLSVSLGKLASLKKGSIEPVISVSLPDSFKKIDGFVASSNSDFGTVNKALADIATSIQMLQNFEVQIKAL